MNSRTTGRQLLSELALLRKDPEIATQMLEIACHGDLDAQFGMGLIYAEGRGVEINIIDSYAWLELAIRQGDQDARDLQAVVAMELSDEQLAEAKARVVDLDVLVKQTQSVHSQRRSRHLH